MKQWVKRLLHFRPFFIGTYAIPLIICSFLKICNRLVLSLLFFWGGRSLSHRSFPQRAHKRSSSVSNLGNQYRNSVFQSLKSLISPITTTTTTHLSSHNCYPSSSSTRRIRQHYDIANKSHYRYTTTKSRFCHSKNKNKKTLKYCLWATAHATNKKKKNTLDAPLSVILTLNTQPRTKLCITIINNGTHVIIFYSTTQKHFSSSNTKTLNKSQIEKRSSFSITIGFGLRRSRTTHCSKFQRVFKQTRIYLPCFIFLVTWIFLLKNEKKTKLMAKV